MESFYHWIRRKCDILMDGNKPVGGKWNYDLENRQAYDDRIPIPKPILVENDVSGLHNMIEKMKVETFGAIEPDKLIWPTTRSQALTLLNAFLNMG